jgi:single-stranded DNA-specific DHH superfamily exonuclease
MHYDVFNGDADGLCALHQLRLSEPKDSVLVTGVKRDIGLLAKVDAAKGDSITVLDISLDKNRTALDKLLAQGTHIRYFDHHYAGENLPSHPCLQTHINTSPEVCTSLLVNAYLNGQFLPWAVTAAFGDNMHASAKKAAAKLNYSDSQLNALCELGTCLNYNGYGSTLDDLHFTPTALYQKMQPYTDPFDFISGEDAYQVLRNGYYDDMAAAENTKPEFVDDHVALYILPEQKWSRRVSGVFGNQLSTAAPRRAHSVLTSLPGGGFMVSVRAPQLNKTGADDLCRSFSTGGGRKGAAGINLLAESDLDLFIQRFRQQYSA